MREEEPTRTYTLPMSALFPLLAGEHTTGHLWADLSLPLPSENRKTRCRAEVILSQGDIISSHIMQEHHVLFSGKEAMRLLVGSEPATWTLTLTLPKRNQQAQSTLTGVPKRTAARVSQQEVARWPRRQKQIYLLIDSKRNSEQIARLLTLPQKEIDAILQKLHEQQLIIF